MRGGVRGKEIISSSVRIMFVSFLKRKRDRDLPSKQLCPTCVKCWITLGPSSSFEYVLGSVFESVYVCVCVCYSGQDVVSERRRVELEEAPWQQKACWCMKTVVRISKGREKWDRKKSGKRSTEWPSVSLKLSVEQYTLFHFRHYFHLILC